MAYTSGARNVMLRAIQDDIDTVKLHTGAPGSSGTSNQVSGGAYSDATFTASASEWTGTSGSVTNANAITFPDASGADWGTVSHFSLWDNTVFRADGSLTTSRNIIDGTTSIEFAVGDLSAEVPAS